VAPRSARVPRPTRCGHSSRRASRAAARVPACGDLVRSLPERHRDARSPRTCRHRSSGARAWCDTARRGRARARPTCERSPHARPRHRQPLSVRRSRPPHLHAASVASHCDAASAWRYAAHARAMVAEVTPGSEARASPRRTCLGPHRQRRRIRPTCAQDRAANRHALASRRSRRSFKPHYAAARPSVAEIVSSVKNLRNDGHGSAQGRDQLGNL
jgi:hypothetical protein